MPNALYFTVHHAPASSRHRFSSMPPPSTGMATEPRRPLERLRRILVATDGLLASDGAMTVAGLLARRHGSIVDVVSVLPRWGPPAPDHALLDVTRELLEERLADVVPQAERALNDAARVWTIRVVDSNSVPASIADTARAEAHDLIVVGSRRGWFDRWFRSPTALAVAQHSDVPVLVVPQGVTMLPRRAVVAADATDAGNSIVTSVGAVLAEDAVIEAAILHGGEPVERLVANAKANGAELIALGLQGSGTLAERIRRGIGRRLLRATDASVLLLPPSSPSPVETRRVRHA